MHLLPLACLPLPSWAQASGCPRAVTAAALSPPCIYSAHFTPHNTSWLYFVIQNEAVMPTTELIKSALLRSVQHWASLWALLRLIRAVQTFRISLHYSTQEIPPTTDFVRLIQLHYCHLFPSSKTDRTQCCSLRKLKWKFWIKSELKLLQEITIWIDCSRAHIKNVNFQSYSTQWEHQASVAHQKFLKQWSSLIDRLSYRFPLGKWFRHFDLKNNSLYFSERERMSLELSSEFRKNSRESTGCRTAVQFKKLNSSF